MTTYASFLVSTLTLTPSLYSSTITLRVPLDATSALLSTTPGTTFIDNTTSKITTGYITVSSNAEDSRIWNIQDTFPYSNFADLERLRTSALGVRSTLYLRGHTDITGRVSTVGRLYTQTFSHEGIPIPSLETMFSTVDGLGTIGYLSSGLYSITSTLEGLGSIMMPPSYLSTSGLVSTVNNLGTLYISYASLTSTISGNTTFIRTSNLASTVDGLGSIYLSSPALQSTISGISSIYTPVGSNRSTVAGLISIEGASLASTVTQLGTIYISSPALQSTVNGLGSLYVSSAQVNLYVGAADSNISKYLLSQMVPVLGSGSNGYMSTPQLVSSVSGLNFTIPRLLASNVRSLGYISTLDLLSTVPGLSPLYVSSLSLQSTVMTLQLQGGSILISTFNGLGSAKYISMPSVISTTTSLSNSYSSNLVAFYVNLGRSYMSTGQIVSTVEGLGSIGYISTASLVSSSLGYVNYVLLNIVNFAGSNYVSTTGLVSTTMGLLAFSNQLASTVSGLGQYYISSAQIVSTVNGLGSSSYISIASLVSSAIQYVNYDNLQLRAMVLNAGTPYVSTSGLVSTTRGLLAFSNQLASTVSGLGQYYISSAQIVSTVNGLGSSSYISIGSLVSSAIQYVNYDNLQLRAMVLNAGTPYVSTSGLVSTTSNLLTSYSNQLISTATGLNPNYAVLTHLVSTVEGLGSAGYISIPSLISSSIYYLNYERIQLQDFVNNAGQTTGVITGYTSTTRLTAFTTGFLNEYSQSFYSTLYGMTNLSYISSGQLVSTVNGLGSLGYISTPNLFSTSIGYSNIAQVLLVNMITHIGQSYISRAGLISTTNGLLSEYASNFPSTINGLGSSSYISTPELLNAVQALQTPPIDYNTYIYRLTLLTTANAANMVNQQAATSAYVASIYSPLSGYLSTTTAYVGNFSNAYMSTARGLGTASYISFPQITSTVNGLGSLSYHSTTSLVSTTDGLLLNQSLQLQGFVVTPMTIYISTLGLVSATVGLSSNYSVALTSTTAGLGKTYISTPQLVSTVQGMGLVYFSTASLTSSFTGVALSNALYQIQTFENTLGSNGYMSTTGILSTVAGLSNTYTTSLNLQSTFAGLANSYITSSNITSTTTGLATQQSNVGIPILTSTVAGLGQIYFSSLTQPLATSAALSNTVSFITQAGYIPRFPLVPNGYLYSTDSANTLGTSNFYEDSNLSYSQIPITVTRSTIANVVRTIGFGTNYLYGGGQYLGIGSDSNLKENIVPLSPSQALDQVTSMRGVYYRKIGDSNPYIGCIAQEVEQVFPQVITTHPSVEPKDLKSMKYEFLLAPLVESVKELTNIHSTIKYFLQKNQGNLQ